MTPNGIAIAVPVAAILAALLWRGWGRFMPRWLKTQQQLAAEEAAAREDTIYLCVADQVVATTRSTGRSSWA